MPAGNEKFGPVGILQPADLHPGVFVGGVMNKLPVPNVRAGVGYILGRPTEKKQITLSESIAFNWHHTLPRSRQIGIAGHYDTAAANQHLGKARTIKPEAGSAAPEVGEAEEMLGELDCLMPIWAMAAGFQSR